MGIRRWHRGLVALLCCAGGLWTVAARADEALDEGSDSALVAPVNQRAKSVAWRRQPVEEMPGPYAGPAYGAVEGCGGGCGCASDGCDSACCCEEDCCGCCCTPGCSCGWYGGAEVVWMKPYWSTRRQSRWKPGGAVFSSSHRGYDYDYDPTARFFVGYTGCNGLGVRASWWEFDHDSAVESATASATTSINTGFLSARGTGDTITTQQRLELQTIDLEFTNCFQACGGDMVVAFGVRYAKFDLDIHEQFLGATVGRAESFDMTQSFEGLGPTVALEFIRPLCFSGLSFYSSLRGSVVFGKLHERDRDVGNTDGLFDDRITFDTDKAQAIADVQIALQYCRCGWFVRGGWQAQYWDTVAHTDHDDFDASRASLGLSGFFVAIGGSVSSEIHQNFPYSV